MAAEEEVARLNLEKQLYEQQLKQTEWRARDLALHSLFLHNKRVQMEKEEKNKMQQVLSDAFIII